MDVSAEAVSAKVDTGFESRRGRHQIPSENGGDNDICNRVAFHVGVRTVVGDSSYAFGVTID